MSNMESKEGEILPFQKNRDVAFIRAFESKHLKEFPESYLFKNLDDEILDFIVPPHYKVKARQFIFVYHHENKPVGFTRFLEVLELDTELKKDLALFAAVPDLINEKQPIAMLLFVGVDKEFRRSGVGLLLAEFSLKYLKDRGHTRVLANIMEGNKKSLNGVKSHLPSRFTHLVADDGQWGGAIQWVVFDI